MSEKYGIENSGLRFLQTEFGDLIDMELEPQKFDDLLDRMQSKPKSVITQKEVQTQAQIPKYYLNKNWDELYQSEQLQKVYKNYPDLYLKLRKQKFNY